MLGGLRQVYATQARRRWWRGAAAASVAMLAVWAFEGRTWGLMAGLLAAWGVLRWFRYRMRVVLSTILGGAGQGRRALALMSRTRQDRRAVWPILAPALVALAVLTMTLPSSAPWGQQARGVTSK